MLFQQAKIDLGPEAEKEDKTIESIADENERPNVSEEEKKQMRCKQKIELTCQTM